MGEGERGARWRLRSPARPKLCPSCLSPLDPVWLSGWLLPEEYTCPNCGYRGHVALEAEEDEG